MGDLKLFSFRIVLRHKQRVIHCYGQFHRFLRWPCLIKIMLYLTAKKSISLIEKQDFNAHNTNLTNIAINCDAAGDSPIKMTGVLVGDFEKNP